MSDQNGAYRLAASGAIGANAMDSTEVGFFAGEYLMRRYPELLQARYGLQELPSPHDCCWRSAAAWAAWPAAAKWT